MEFSVNACFYYINNTKLHRSDHFKSLNKRRNRISMCLLTKFYYYFSDELYVLDTSSSNQLQIFADINEGGLYWIGIFCLDKYSLHFEKKPIKIGIIVKQRYIINVKIGPWIINVEIVPLFCQRLWFELLYLNHFL